MLGFLSSVTLTQIATNRIKNKVFDILAKYMIDNDWRQRTIIVIISIFFGQNFFAINSGVLFLD